MGVIAKCMLIGIWHYESIFTTHTDCGCSPNNRRNTIASTEGEIKSVPALYVSQVEPVNGIYMFTKLVEKPCCDHPRGLQEMLQDKTRDNQTSRCCSRHCHQHTHIAQTNTIELTLPPTHTHIAQTNTIELTRTVITKLWHPPNIQDECPSSWLFTLPSVSQFLTCTFWPLQDLWNK